MKVYIYPSFGGKDDGDGGVRRVVEAQHKYLPQHGIEVVTSPSAADLIAVHIMAGTEANRYPHVPIVAHSHGLYWAEYEWASWAIKANEGCMELIRQADAVTAPSEWVAQTIRRNTLREVTAVGHGIEMEDWPAKNVGVGKGYVLWNKNRTDQVCSPDALDKLVELAPDIPFISTFGGGYVVMEGHPQPIQPAPNLTITGRLPYQEAKQVVRDATVYLCSARETFGIGTIEAMAAGVPVLGWAWGAQVDIVEHKKTGYLAKPGDFDDLLAGLRYILANRVKMGLAARKVAESRYTWAKAIEGYLPVYEAAVARHAAYKASPRFSVVVPAYNLEKYLPETLDSVKAQTATDWECIIVDDASPDGSWKVAKKYAKEDDRFRLIRNKENLYLAGALNAGIAEAKGRYILPLDADNLIVPETLEILGGVLDHNRGAHIAYGGVQFILPDGEPDHSVGFNGFSGWPAAFRGDWQVALRRNMVPSTALYRREVWEQTGGYRRRYRTAEDADFWTRATSYGYRAVMGTQATTLIYRQRPDSMSRMEEKPDWAAWLPWANGGCAPPAGIIGESIKQHPIYTYDPPFVSVIIPVGPGHEELLIDALDSVDGQTMRHFECIVVNDTGAPLRWLPSWATLITSKGKEGVAAARNLGIAASRASLFLPLDADDTLEPQALEHMLRVQREFGGVVYSDWWDRYEDGRQEIWQTPQFDGQLLITDGAIHAVTALYPREAWEKVGGFDPTMAWEDWDFQLAMCRAGYCGTRIPVPLFTYRKDTGMRREEAWGGGLNSEGFLRSKEGILSKWDEYFRKGGKPMGGCGSCGGGGGGRVQGSSFVQRNQQTISENPEDYVIVEYVGGKQGMMNYSGPSGQVYQFAATETERQKFVKKEDADWFAAKPAFRVRMPDAAPVI